MPNLWSARSGQKTEGQQLTPRRSFELLRRHSFPQPGSNDAEQWPELLSLDVKRVSNELKEPVSPTSMHVVIQRLQHRRRHQTPNIDCPPSFRASDPGSDDFTHLLCREAPLISMAVHEESPGFTFEEPADGSIWDQFPQSKQVHETLMFDDDADDKSSSTAGHSSQAAWSTCSDPDLNSPFMSPIPSPRQLIKSQSMAGRSRPAHSSQSDSGSLSAGHRGLLSRSISSPSRSRLPSTRSDTGCHSSQGRFRHRYIRTEGFRQRRLTDSDAVANLGLGQGLKNPDRPLDDLARELGLSLSDHLRPTRRSQDGDPHLFVSPLGWSPPAPPSPKDSSKSPRNHHPTVKLRKLRSNSRHFCDEPRPVIPSAPFVPDVGPGPPGRVLRSLRSTPPARDKMGVCSPTSALARSSTSGNESRQRASDSGGYSSNWSSGFSMGKTNKGMLSSRRNSLV